MREAAGPSPPPRMSCCVMEARRSTFLPGRRPETGRAILRYAAGAALRMRGGVHSTGMSCLPCAGVIICGRSGHRPSSRAGPWVYPPVSPASHLRHGSLLSSPVRSVLPAAGLPGGGTLIRAYPARAPAPAGARFAAARFVRLIAPARARARAKARAQDTPVPSPSRAFSRAAANGCSLRMPLPPDLYRQGGPLVNALQGIFTKIKNKTAHPIPRHRERLRRRVLRAVGQGRAEVKGKLAFVENYILRRNEPAE